MDFMKVFDQTVREIKREVNLKVLKVPEIEQKVLDATDNEPWGPHGEIAQATKRFSECQMVMNVLWTRLGETGKDWRYVYKALAVIEYLVAHGSERAVDEIIEHTYQISSLRSFEYVEPNGKDSGINVRKKAENIVALLNDRDKIQEVRDKAAANRDKYFGLSSTGVTHKSGATSYSGGGYYSSDRYGSMSGKRYSDWSRDSYRDRHEEEKSEPDYFDYIRNKGVKSDDQGYTSRRIASRSSSKDQGNISTVSKSSSASPSSGGPSADDNDDLDDFDPRGASTNKPASVESSQADLFGQSLIDLDGPPSGAPVDKIPSEVDLFADATFVSASPLGKTQPGSQTQNEVDLFASQPTISSAAPSTIDLFASSEPVEKPDANPSRSEPESSTVVDPFAAVPMNNFDGSDMFGAFTSHSNAVPGDAAQNATSDGAQNRSSDDGKNSLRGKSLAYSSPTPKNNTFQVKSGIWADSLSRGLIDLNITAPKKVSLADVGVVGGLSNGSEETAKGLPTAFYMGRAMGSGTGLGRTGFGAPDSSAIPDDFFSGLGGQPNQFGSMK